MKYLYTILLSIATIAIAAAEVATVRVANIVSKEGKVETIPLDAIDYIEIVEIPAAPSGLKASVLNHQVYLSWEPEDDDSIRYNIYHSIDGDEYSILAKDLSASNYIHIRPESTTNYYAVSALREDIEGPRSEVRMADMSHGLLPQGNYASISLLYSSLLHSQTKSISNDGVKYLKSYVNGIGKAGGSAHYYLLDTALDSLAYSDLPEDLANISVICAFNSPDQRSVPTSGKYDSNSQYREALKEKINEMHINGIPVDSYMMAVVNASTNRPWDVVNDVEQLSTSDNGTIHHDIEDLTARLDTIADDIISKCSTDSRDLLISLGNLTDRKRIKITLDYTDVAIDSQFFIEGTFDEETGNLTKVTFAPGISAPVGDCVEGEMENMRMKYLFPDIRIEGNKLIAASNVKVWYFDERQSVWVRDALFDKNKNLSIKPHYKSSLVRILLDHGGWSAEEYATLQNGLCSFFDRLNLRIGQEVDTPYWTEIAGPREIKKVLFLGNSFFCPQGAGTNEWYRFGAMAPSVGQHTITEFVMRRIRERYPDATYITHGTASWERNHIYSYFSYSDWLANLDGYQPDIVYIWATDNATHTDLFLPESRKFLKECVERWPDAEIYACPSWWRGDKWTDFKLACEETRVHFLNAIPLRNANLMWQPGDYYYSEDDGQYYGLKYTVTSHPNDVGSMIIANKFLEYSGFETWNLTHDILLTTTGRGKVSTPNTQWLGDGIVTLRIEEGEVESVNVTGYESGIDIPATYRSNNQNENYSDYYTFTMPHEDVEVTVRFKSDLPDSGHFLPHEDYTEFK